MAAQQKIVGVNTDGNTGYCLYLTLIFIIAAAALVYIVYLFVSAPAHTMDSALSNAKKLLQTEIKITEKITSEFSAIDSRQDLLVCSEYSFLSDFKTIAVTKLAVTSKGYFALRVPVEYNFYVPMNDRRQWHFKYSDGTVWVDAPELKCLTPNIKWRDSEEFIYGGLLIDSQKSSDELKDMLLKQARVSAAASARSDNVRHAARISLAKFLNEWLLLKLKNELQINSVAIKFKDENSYPPVLFAVAKPRVPVEKSELPESPGGIENK
ncbi:MAG: hypothetical protein WCV67_07920 [Victivallaceae bacterium]|jgi:hypothetical protein